MKGVFVILGLLWSSASAIPRFNDQLRELVETLRLQLPCGFPSLGIPPLAPYTNEFQRFDLNNSGMDLSGNLTNFIVTGINGFEVKELNWSTLFMKMNFDVNFNQIKFFSQYYAKGGLTIFGKPISLVGDGDFDLVAENLRINGSFRIRPTTSNGLKISGFKSSFDLDRVQSKTTGILNSAFYSRLFNEWVEETFRILVEDYKDDVGERLGIYITRNVNQLLKDISLMDLVGLIFGYGSSGPIFPVCEVN